MKNHSKVLLCTASALGVLCSSALISASPATAGGRSSAPPTPRVVADGLLTPLSLAIDHRGSALVSQNFAGELLRISPNGTRTTIATVPGQEVGAVATRGKTIYWATTGQDPEAPSAALWRQSKNGAPRQIADLRALEETQNPDQDTIYGFRRLPAECAAQFPAENPASYTGLVDSHPYASYADRDRVYVADAGANAIVSVRTQHHRKSWSKKNRQPRVVATLPAVSTRVSADALTALGLPTCAAGYRYHFEFVPTDVEKGRDGKLYVTSLPGGPEDASLGARGAVYKVDPRSGKARLVAGGFVGAVNLALGPDGTMAVAEMFGGDDGTGQVTLLRAGSHRRTELALTSPGALEWVGSKKHSKLYVTTDAFVLGEQGPQPVGKLQVLRFGSHRR